MPVCIAGAPRSGTSLTAMLLNACGLSLGPAAELLPPGPDNPDGFWENRRVVALNDDLLAPLGGSWNDPPDPPAGWEFDQALHGFYARARRTAVLLSARGPWGWKDPRCSLLLPFWRRAVPGLRVVVCVRHPAEVARSLEARGDRTSPRLWLTYNRRLLADSEGCRIVTLHRRYFTDPAAELARLAGLLGLSADQGTVAAAAALVKPGLRHHQGCEMSDEEADVYAQLCSEADIRP